MFSSLQTYTIRKCLVSHLPCTMYIYERHRKNTQENLQNVQKYLNSKKYLCDPSLAVTAHSHHESQSGRVIKSRWAKFTQKRTGDCCWGGERRGWSCLVLVKICTILAVASFSRTSSGGGGTLGHGSPLFPPVICSLHL